MRPHRQIISRIRRRSISLHRHRSTQIRRPVPELHRPRRHHRATLNPDVGVIYTVTYSPTQDLIAAGGSSKQSVQLLADPAAAAKLVCESVVDPISPAEWAVHVPGVTYRSPCQDPAAP